VLVKAQLNQSVGDRCNLRIAGDTTGARRSRKAVEEPTFHSLSTGLTLRFLCSLNSSDRFTLSFLAPNASCAGLACGLGLTKRRLLHTMIHCLYFPSRAARNSWSAHLNPFDIPARCAEDFAGCSRASPSYR
jgi:hypothetical protein